MTEATRNVLTFFHPPRARPCERLYLPAFLVPLWVLAGCQVTPAMNPIPSPPSQRPPAAESPPVSSDSVQTPARKLTVSEPRRDSLQESPVRVVGQSAENPVAVSAIVRDAAGKELGRSSTTVETSEAQKGKFALSVEFAMTPQNQPGTLEVFSLSPSDGSITGVIRIPITLTR